MENATPRKAHATASPATLETPVRTSAQICAVVKANALQEDACALLALLESTVQSRPAAVDTVIALFRVPASAILAGWALSVLLRCNVQTRLAADTGHAQMAIVLARLASPA